MGTSTVPAPGAWPVASFSAPRKPASIVLWSPISLVSRSRLRVSKNSPSSLALPGTPSQCNHAQVTARLSAQVVGPVPGAGLQCDWNERGRGYSEQLPFLGKRVACGETGRLRVSRRFSGGGDGWLSGPGPCRWLRSGCRRWLCRGARGRRRSWPGPDSRGRTRHGH